ncbi:MAG: hypothetical protein ACYDB3_10140 [Acidimicrobiales bacterium]
MLFGPERTDYWWHALDAIGDRRERLVVLARARATEALTLMKIQLPHVSRRPQILCKGPSRLAGHSPRKSR